MPIRAHEWLFIFYAGFLLIMEDDYELLNDKNEAFTKTLLKIAQRNIYCIFCKNDKFNGSIGFSPYDLYIN